MREPKLRMQLGYYSIGKEKSKDPRFSDVNKKTALSSGGCPKRRTIAIRIRTIAIYDLIYYLSSVKIYPNFSEI